jgi:hypothetical protein
MVCSSADAVAGTKNEAELTTSDGTQIGQSGATVRIPL